MPLTFRKISAPGIIVSAASTAPVATTNAPPGTSSKSTPAKRKSYSGHSKHLPIDFDLHRPGRVRTGHLLTLLHVSHSKFCADRKAGKILPPDGHDPRAWWWNETACKIVYGESPRPL
jgi:hypothetical protein